MNYENTLPRIGRLARVGEIVALLAAVGVGGFAIATWFDQPALLATLASGVPNAPVPVGGVLVAAYLLSLVPAALFVVAMVQAGRLFGLLRGGRVFVPAVPRALSWLGVWAALSAVAGVLVRMGLGLVLTANGPPGSRALIIGIGSNEIASLVMALLLFIFALVMREAIEFEADSRGVV